MTARPVPKRHGRSYGNDPLPTRPEALLEPFNAFPSWFLRIECDRCGKVQMVSQAHSAQSYQRAQALTLGVFSNRLAVDSVPRDNGMGSREMGQPVEITRLEHSASELRAFAAKIKDAAIARRLLALALVLEGHPGCDNEYWPTCADEYWPTLRYLTC
jgi:hypothetical protein